VRVEHIEQRFADFREVIVDLEMDPGGEEGERFQQALDVRVGAAVRLEQEPRERRPRPNPRMWSARGL